MRESFQVDTSAKKVENSLVLNQLTLIFLG